MPVVSQTSKLAVPFSVLLISFLAFPSQVLFKSIEPGPLNLEQTLTFNLEILATFVCYLRCLMADPGWVPPEWTKLVSSKESPGKVSKPTKTCKKCDAPKPPRAHHCKVCKRCIAKMDHHCPWTGNCVGYRVMPHFVRFLFYGVLSMISLEFFLFIRLAVLWEQRKYPVSYGPSVTQLIHLILLFAVNSIAMLALTILFLRTIWNLGANETTIETWEIERHEAVLKRAKRNGGFVSGPDGQDIRIERHEFPYDVGIWRNIMQSMGTGNIFAWFWPFSKSPSISQGLDFEINDFNEPHMSWPPPDPDCVRMPQRTLADLGSLSQHTGHYTSKDIKAFRERQENDLKRFDTDFFTNSSRSGLSSLPATWRNNEDESLDDYGVDEEEYFVDEDVPLAELISRRKKD